MRKARQAKVPQGVQSRVELLLYFMFSEFSKHSTYINVPIRLSNKYRKDRHGWDLLVFAICLKLNKGNSGIYLTNERALMKFLHCSYRKAHRLMAQAINNTDLFRYNHKTHFLCAKSFKIGCKVSYSNRGNFVMRSDKCIAVEIGKDGIKHNEISKQLRDKLILRLIKVKATSDELYCHNPSVQRCDRPLTQEYLGNVAGCHQTTVSRHLRKLSKDGRIKITSHDKIAVWDLEHGIVINDIPRRKPFISGRFAYIRDVNDYTILDNSIMHSYKNVIYNHKGRQTENRIIKFHWEL